MPPPTTRRHLGHALALIIAFVVLVRWLGQRVLLAHAPPPIAMTAIFVLQFGVVLWLGLFRAAKLAPRDVGWRFPRPLRQIALGVVGFAASAAGLVGLLVALGVLDPAALWRAIAGYSLGQRAFFAAIGIQAALAEETLFRGYLQGALVVHVGPAAAVAITACLFAAAHLTFAPTHLAAQIWLGLVYGALRQIDGTVLPPAIAHALLWAVWGDA